MTRQYGKEKPYQGSEDNFQKATNRLLSAKYPEVALHAFHVPNGGNRPTVTKHLRGKTYRYSPAGKALKEMGAMAGVSDWVILYPTFNEMRGYFGACIELKAKGGSLQKSQKEFLERMGKAGYFVAICWSLDGFEDALTEFIL